MKGTIPNATAKLFCVVSRLRCPLSLQPMGRFQRLLARLKFLKVVWHPFGGFNRFSTFGAF